MFSEIQISIDRKGQVLLVTENYNADFSQPSAVVEFRMDQRVHLRTKNQPLGVTVV